MQPLTCIIVDDEPMALCLLESYVQKSPSLQLVGKFSNAIEVLQFLHNHPAPALIYMDIQMPELNGLQLSKKLSTASKIVFTTAFDQYALEGYKVNAIGYLLKPFDYSEFLETVDRLHTSEGALQRYSLYRTPKRFCETIPHRQYTPYYHPDEFKEIRRRFTS